MNQKCCHRNFKGGSFDWKLEGLVPFLIVESEGNQNPSHVSISSKTSNQNFQIAILFNVVKRSGNYVLKNETPFLHSPQGRGCKLCPGGIQGLCRKGDRINFGEGSLDW